MNKYKLFVLTGVMSACFILMQVMKVLTAIFHRKFTFIFVSKNVNSADLFQLFKSCQIVRQNVSVVFQKPARRAENLKENLLLFNAFYKNFAHATAKRSLRNDEIFRIFTVSAQTYGIIMLHSC